MFFCYFHVLNFGNFGNSTFFILRKILFSLFVQLIEVAHRFSKLFALFWTNWQVWGGGGWGGESGRIGFPRGSFLAWHELPRKYGRGTNGSAVLSSSPTEGYKWEDYIIESNVWYLIVVKYSFRFISIFFYFYWTLFNYWYSFIRSALRLRDVVLAYLQYSHKFASIFVPFALSQKSFSSPLCMI